jgi:hypothetical protein
MLGGIRFVIASTFFIIAYLTILAPAIDSVSNSVQSLDSTGGIAIYQTLETVLFVGMPLIFVGGILVVVFLVAAGGRRGTSR